jgi:D-cysteine desulfhydrase
MEELKKQTEVQKIDSIVFASCSGGTHAGMVLGKQIYNTEQEIIGISIEKDMTGEIPLKEHIVSIANGAAGLLDVAQRVTEKDVTLVDGYNEAGYGVVTSQEVDAISVLAKSEGIFLDPVYTGRAFAGLLDMLKKGYFQNGSNIMFWHTGGAPANFHYANQIQL